MDASSTLVIAGAGDVGMRVAAARAALGDEVIAVRRGEGAVSKGVRPVRADLASGEGFDRLPRQASALVFCAAPGERNEAAYQSLYVDGLRRLLDTVQAGRVVFVSSTSVYAQDAGEWIDERSPARADSFNGRALLMAETQLQSHPEATALRLSGLYGPGRSSMLARALEGRANARRWTNRIHVDDAAAAISRLLDTPRLQRTYVGSDDLPVLECDLQDWLRSLDGLAPVGSGAAGVSGRRACNARLRSTGWSPRFADYRAGHAALRQEGRV